MWKEITCLLNCGLKCVSLQVVARWSAVAFLWSCTFSGNLQSKAKVIELDHSYTASHFLHGSRCSNGQRHTQLECVLHFTKGGSVLTFESDPLGLSFVLRCWLSPWHTLCLYLHGLLPTAGAPSPFCSMTHSKGHTLRNAWRTDGIKPTPCPGDTG